MKIKIDISEFEFVKCGVVYLDEIVQIQAETLSELSNPDILRENSREMLLECLNPPHYTLGVLHDGVLAAFGMLYFPHDEAENLSLSLTDVDIVNKTAANFKLCIVRKPYRGNALQQEIGRRLEEYAVAQGVQLLCATIHPDNRFSIESLSGLGFTYNKTCIKYGFKRNLYYKPIQ